MHEEHHEAILNELDRLEREIHSPSQDKCERNFKRFVVRGVAELHPMSRASLDTTPIEVQLRDLGRGGVGFISQQNIPIGSSWRMCFLRHGYVIGSQPIIARYSQPAGNGLYLSGAQFVIETGLLTLLGIDPAKIAQTETVNPDNFPRANFITPTDVA